MNENELIKKQGYKTHIHRRVHSYTHIHIKTRERSKYLRLDNKTMTKIRKKRSNTMNNNIFTNKE